MPLMNRYEQTLQEFEVALAAARRAGSSPDMASSAGLLGATIPAIAPYILIRITARKNYDADNPDPNKYPAYSYTIVRERDILEVVDDTDDGVQRIFMNPDEGNFWGAYDGDFDKINPDFVPDPDRPDLPDSYMYPALEMNRNADVPTDGSVVVQAWPAEGARHYWFSYPVGNRDNDIFPVTLTRKNHVDDGIWRYSYTKDTFAEFEVQTKGNEEKGTLRPTVTYEHTQIDEPAIPTADIITITVEGATGGTYTLSDSGGDTTAPLAFDASDGTINTALAGLSPASTFTVSTTVTTDALGVVTYKHVFTSSDPGVAHDITMDGSLLEPLAPHYPAVFRNNVPMGVPVAAWLKKAAGDVPKYLVQISQQPNTEIEGSEKHTIIQLTLKNLRDGKYKLRFTKDDAWQTLNWDATDTDIQTALSMLLTCTVTGGDMGAFTKVFSIEVTADYDPHTLLVDLSLAFGTKYYVVVWSNGNACTGPFGGLDPQAIDGYAGKTLPSITVTQTLVGDSSTQKDTFVLQVFNATGGTYDVIADAGGTPIGPVNTAYNACPSIGSGWVPTTNADGTCTLVAPNTTPGHTINAYASQLRNIRAVRQYLAEENDCALLVTPTKCPPVELMMGG